MKGALCLLTDGPLDGMRLGGNGQPEKLSVPAMRERIGPGPDDVAWCLGPNGSPHAFDYYRWSDGKYYPTPEPQAV